MYYTDYLEHYGVKGMKWRNARKKKRTRTGYQDISPHTPSEEEKQKANARLQKASTLSVKTATTTFNAVTNAGFKFLDSIFHASKEGNRNYSESARRSKRSTNK